jgi:hypothetical protein
VDRLNRAMTTTVAALAPGPGAEATASGRSPYHLASMSTRKLIAVALACALVILLAGGIQLVLLSRHDTVRVDALSPGQSSQVGDVEVTVLATALTSGTMHVTASLNGPGDLSAMAKAKFALLARQQALAVVESQSSCQQTGDQAQCDLVFDAGTTNLDDAAVVYRGAKASWALH